MKKDQYKCIKDVILTTGIAEVKDNEFRDCLELESIVIPEGVTEIGWFAFAGCANLKSVTLPKSIRIIGIDAFDQSLQEINYAGTKEEWNRANFDLFFDSCVVKCEDGEIVIEGSTCCSDKEIDEDKRIVIPEGITSIEADAFSGSEYGYIESITIPSSVKSIGENAFNRWLRVIHYAGTKEEWNLINEETLSEYDFYSLLIKCKNGEIYLNGRSASPEENPEDYKRLIDEYHLWNDF